MKGCLGLAELHEFISGRVNKAELHRIYQHLNHCSSCSERLESLESRSEDTLIDALRLGNEMNGLWDGNPQARRTHAFEDMPPNDEKLKTATGPIDDRGKHYELEETVPMEGDANNCYKDRNGVEYRTRKFGQYELLHEIARGGMGVVYKARQIRLNRIVAIKTILSGELAGSEEVKRFQKEAEAAAILDHPGIVPIFEIGQHADQHYFSMGYVDGPSLQRRLTAGPLPSREAARLCQRIAEAVAYAHSQGVIHRDLKPGNVLLDSRDEPRVTDFGLAKQVADDSGLTRTGAIMGTPSYMPPEQASGRINEVGPRADVYSIGAILFCMLTGKPPFQAATIVETLRQVIEREPISPRLLNPNVDVDLETICLKCLEKDSGHRITSAAELAAELNRYQQGEPIRSRRLGVVNRSLRWLRRNRMPTALVFTLIFAVLVGIGASGVARRSAALRQLVQSSNAFETGVERLELTQNQLQALDTLVAQVEQQDPDDAKIFRQRLLDTWTDLTERAIRRPYLQESALQQIEFALSVLWERDAARAEALQALFAQRKSQWQPTFALTAPFQEATNVFGSERLLLRENALYRLLNEDTFKEDSATRVSRSHPAVATDVILTRFTSGTRAQMQASFAADWEQSEELGLMLNHRQDEGYTFSIRPVPSDSLEHKLVNEPDLLAEFRRLTFAETRQLNGRVLVEILRHDSPVRKAELPIREVSQGPLQLRVKRERDELSVQINNNDPIVFRDPFPISAGNDGSFAVHWPKNTGLIDLSGERRIAAGGVTKLDKADALYEQGSYEAAMDLYDKIAIEEPEREVQQEARLKRGICLLQQNRFEDAIEVLQPLFSEAGDRWPARAGVQLWLLMLRQGHYDEADAVYHLLSTRFTFSELALLVPTQVREEILAAYTGMLATINNAISFHPSQLNKVKRAADADRLLSYDGRGSFTTQMELSRAYRFVEDYEGALSVLSPIVRTTYFSTAWHHYLRTLRFLGRHDDALRECTDWLDVTSTETQPNEIALLNRMLIQVAREDWNAVEADLRRFTHRNSEHTIQPGIEVQWTLPAGFLCADRGDQRQAMQWWQQGYRNGRQLLAESKGNDSASMFVLIMGAFSDELTDVEVWNYFRRLAGESDSPVLNLAGQMVDQDKIGGLLRRMWKTPRGQDIARGFAFDKLSLRQRIEAPVKLAATQYFVDFALGGQSTPEQEQIIWQAMTIALQQVVEERRLSSTQVMQIGLTWKGTSNFLGWGGVAPTLDPALRGPLAYIMAHRYTRLNKLSLAQDFFRTAHADAAGDSKLAKLAETDLKLLETSIETVGQ